MSHGRAHPLTTYSATMVERLTSTAQFDCLPCQDRAEYAVDEEPTTDLLTAVGYWEGVIGIEGEMTGDGRMIAPDALRWENFPLPIRYAPEDNGAHDGAVSAGNIQGVERRDNGEIWAWGDWDLGSEAGREAQRVVGNQVQNGVSMDLDDVSFEIQVAADVIEEMDSMMESLMDEDGEAPVRQTTPDGERVVVAEISSDDEVMVTTSARVRAATIVSIPAFDRARINNTEEVPEALVAGGAFARPPASWFTPPKFTGPTPLHVGEDGRVYGHLAAWGTCHIGHAHKGCITPPHSSSGYGTFLRGTVLTAEGTEVRVGQITMDTGHASLKADVQGTLAHYDNTGLAAADVAVGEDQYGIWVAGAVRHSLSEEDRATLRAHPISGDWRWIGGQQELVAALAVNVPGYPIPRPSGRVNGGNVMALVASGMVAPEVPDPTLSDEDVAYLRVLMERGREQDKARAHSLRRRVTISQLSLKAPQIQKGA